MCQNVCANSSVWILQPRATLLRVEAKECSWYEKITRALNLGVAAQLGYRGQKTKPYPAAFTIASSKRKTIQCSPCNEQVIDYTSEQLYLLCPTPRY